MCICVSIGSFRIYLLLTVVCFIFDLLINLICLQKGELRCLLPRSLLNHGFFETCDQQKQTNDQCTASQVCNYSWCGQRKKPSYINKLVFPEDFVTSLRTIAMREEELYHVSSLLEEVMASPCQSLSLNRVFYAIQVTLVFNCICPWLFLSINYLNFKKRTNSVTIFVYKDMHDQFSLSSCIVSTRSCTLGLLRAYNQKVNV